jgi:hypothetical protein
MKPEMKYKVVVGKVMPDSFDFCADARVAEKMKEFGHLVELRNKYVLYIDQRYDVTEITEYLKELANE